VTPYIRRYADECLVKMSGTWSCAKLSVDDIDDLEVVRRVMAKVEEIPWDESRSRYGLEHTMWAYDQVTNE